MCRWHRSIELLNSNQEWLKTISSSKVISLCSPKMSRRAPFCKYSFLTSSWRSSTSDFVLGTRTIVKAVEFNSALSARRVSFYM